MKKLRFAILLGLPLAHGHCQSIKNAPAFEVASITPCKPGTPQPLWEHEGNPEFTYPGGRFRANETSLKFLLEWAYGIIPAQHTGGPDWLANDRYVIEAKAPGNASEEEMKLMTQALMAERFKLKFHRETREIPVLVVSVGKSAPKLTTPADEEKRSLKIEPQMGADHKVASFRIVGTRFSIAQFNTIFARQLGRVFVDQTGLKGEFNFALELAPDESRPNPLDPSLVIAAMQSQLGLMVKSQKAPVDFMVIDSAEKVAAGN